MAVDVWGGTESGVSIPGQLPREARPARRGIHGRTQVYRVHRGGSQEHSQPEDESTTMVNVSECRALPLARTLVDPMQMNLVTCSK